jgi:succinoglycan biosynthesis transport protein ExoP
LTQRRALIVLVAGLALGLVFLGVAELRPTKYSATSTLLLKNPTAADALFASGAPPSAQSIERELATVAELGSLDSVAAKTAGELEGLSPDQVGSMVRVDKGPAMNLISIEAVADSAAEAKTVANTYARQFIAFRVLLSKGKLKEARARVERELEGMTKAERESAEGRNLNTTAEKLAALAKLQTGGVAVVERARVPASPSSPKPLRDALIGLGLGILVGLGAVLFFDRLRGRLADPADAGRALGLPVLETVREGVERPADGTETAAVLASSGGRPGGRGETLLVTAGRTGEGISTTAWGLATSASQSRRILLIEADARRPSLAGRHGLSPAPGLAELLVGAAAFDDVVQTVPGDEEPRPGRLDAIAFGSDTTRAPLEAEEMREILARAAERYDLVLVDAPAIGAAPDAFPLVREVDRIIVVCRLGRSSQVDAEHLRTELDRLGGSPLGVIVIAPAREKWRRRRWLPWPGWGKRPAGAEGEGA